MQQIFEADDEYIGNCGITNDHNYAIDPSGLLDAVPQPAVSDELGAFVDIEDVSCHTTVVTEADDPDTASADESEDDYEGSVTRCICDFQHDDEYMICCDQCSVWQHVDCMGVNRNNIPDTYLCELCNPRPVDKRRAIRLQLAKKDQMEAVDSSATDSGTEDVLTSQMFVGSVHKKYQDHTVSQDERPPRQYKTNKFDNDNDDGDWLTKRSGSDLRGGRQHKLRGAANSRPSVRGRRRGFLLDSYQNVTIDHSQADVINNTYTDRLTARIMSGMESGAAFPLQSVPFVNAALFKEQLSRQRFRITQGEPKTMEATVSLRINQPVAEYTGRVMLREEFEEMQPASYFSMVLFYSGLPGLVICIDASASDNLARYIRYSCTPNTKVEHVLEKNTIRFYICATKNIMEGKEITMPFSYDYRKCNSNEEVECACDRPACPVARFFQYRTVPRPRRWSKEKVPSATSNVQKEKASPTKRRKIQEFCGHPSSAAFVNEQLPSRREMPLKPDKPAATALN